MNVLEFDHVCLAVDTFGDKASPPVVLLAGATQSMDWWTPDFCELLAAQGLYVIRYDQRDTGQSSASPPGEPDYSDAELAQDPLRILDALGLASAHLVGLSMGGAIAQYLGVNAPRRVLTLTLIESSPIGGKTGALPPPLPPHPALAAEDAKVPVVSDWTDASSVIDFRVQAERPYRGAAGFDDGYARAIAAREVARSTSMESSVRNHFLVAGGVEADPAMIAAPTLVIHSDTDPLFPLPHGEALARMIPGATLLTVRGMGHEAPPPRLWGVVVPAMGEHMRRHGGHHVPGTAATHG